MGILNKALGFFGVKNQVAVGMNDDELLEWLGINKKTKTLSEVTYFTCLKMLCETMGKLPLKYYQETANGKIRAEPDDITRLFTVRPNRIMTPTTFWSTVELNRQHHGNGYVWMRRGFVKQKYGGEYKTLDMWILPTQYTSVVMDSTGIFAGKGQLYYEYTDPKTGEFYVFPDTDVMHFKTSHTFDGIMGKPVREIIGELIDGAKGGQDYSSNMSKNGLAGAMVLQYAEDLDKAKIQKLKAKYKSYMEDARNAGGVIPVPPGLELKPVAMNLTDAQFYEIRKYTALQIAAGFGIKPNQLNDYEKSSYANSELQQLAFLVDTMAYHLKGYEEEINYKAVSPEAYAQGFFYKFNEKAVLRTDARSQMTIIKLGLDGIYSHNEARRLLDLPDTEGGDVVTVNGSVIPLSMVGQQYMPKQNNASTGEGGDNSGQTDI